MAVTTFLDKLTFTRRYTSLANLGRELGVTGRAVGYWTTGERMPTMAHRAGIDRMYERFQYSDMTGRGLAPQAAAKYRGLTPDTFDLWTERLESTVKTMRTNRVIRYLDREGIDADSLTSNEIRDLLSYYDEGSREALDEFGGDIEEAEEYF